MKSKSAAIFVAVRFRPRLAGAGLGVLVMGVVLAEANRLRITGTFFAFPFYL
jgi:hypothetical protein